MSTFTNTFASAFTALRFALTVAVGAVGAVGAASAVGAAGAAEGNRMHGVWPVGPAHTIVRGFEAPATRYAAGHRGIDLAATVDEPVVATAAGVVSFAGMVVDRPVVSIVHPGGYVSTVEPVSPSGGSRP